MTGEEAVDILRCRKDGDAAEALEVVLKIAEAEPCEDTISRKHLLSQIDYLMKSPWFNSGKDSDIIMHYGYLERKEAVEIVRDLCVKEESSVQPERKHGTWIRQGNDHTDYYECSECGWAIGLDDIRTYCGFCGARMDGEEK